MFTTKHKYVRGKKCCQVFVSDEGCVAMCPMKTQHAFSTTLHWFCKEAGVLVYLMVDGFSAQKKLSVKQFCDQVGTTLKILKCSTP